MSLAGILNESNLDPRVAHQGRQHAETDRLLGILRQGPFVAGFAEHRDPVKAIFIFLIKEIQIRLLGVPRGQATYADEDNVLNEGQFAIVSGHGSVLDPIQVFMPPVWLHAQWSEGRNNQRWVLARTGVDGRLIAGPRLVEMPVGKRYAYANTREAKAMAAHYKADHAPFLFINTMFITSFYNNPHAVIPYNMHLSVSQGGAPLQDLRTYEHRPEYVEFDCAVQRLQDGFRHPVVHFRLHLRAPREAAPAAERSLASTFAVGSRRRGERSPSVLAWQ